MAEVGDKDEVKILEVETPLGKVKTQGFHLGNILQMAIVALLAFGVYLFLDMRNEARSTWERMGNAAKAEHAALSVSIDHQTESQEEMNYILTLNPQQREALNLAMPKSLRDKIIRGR